MRCIAQGGRRREVRKGMTQCASLKYRRERRRREKEREREMYKKYLQHCCTAMWHQIDR